MYELNLFETADLYLRLITSSFGLLSIFQRKIPINQSSKSRILIELRHKTNF